MPNFVDLMPLNNNSDGTYVVNQNAAGKISPESPNRIIPAALSATAIEVLSQPNTRHNSIKVPPKITSLFPPLSPTNHDEIDADFLHSNIQSRQIDFTALLGKDFEENKTRTHTRTHTLSSVQDVLSQDDDFSRPTSAVRHDSIISPEDILRNQELMMQQMKFQEMQLKLREQYTVAPNSANSATSALSDDSDLEVIPERKASSFSQESISAPSVSIIPPQNLTDSHDISISDLNITPVCSTLDTNDVNPNDALASPAVVPFDFGFSPNKSRQKLQIPVTLEETGHDISPTGSHAEIDLL